MQNNVEAMVRSQLDTVFAQLNPQAVEEFYAAYQYWSLQQRVHELRQRIDAVQGQQIENEQRISQTRPSPIALAALARLQSNGVSDMELLDTMLERGEAWLDLTMQRLDYFEQFEDFISDDYTKWCQGAVEGAFDWIDSVREADEQNESVAHGSSVEEVHLNGEDAEEVEALLLQRLAIEDKEDDLSWQEAITLKRPAIQVFSEESATVAPTEEEKQTGERQTELPEGDREGPLPAPPGPRLYYDDGSDDPGAFIVEAGADAEERGDPRGRLAVPIMPDVEAEDTPLAEQEQPALIEFASTEVPVSDEDTLYIKDEQPTLVEFAAVEEPATVEAEPGMLDEQPTLIEFAAQSVVSPAEEEAIDQVAEQTTTPEIVIPEGISEAGNAVQDGANEPAGVEMVAPEAVTPRDQQAIKTGETIKPAQSTRRKRGLIGTLIWILTGK